jgi:hypothetical protein
MNNFEGPKSKEKLKVIAWAGLSYECGVIGPYFFDVEGKSDAVKTTYYLETIKRKFIHPNDDIATLLMYFNKTERHYIAVKKLLSVEEKFDEDRLILRNSSFA